jgi:exopolysaccharide production protein ExoQ
VQQLAALAFVFGILGLFRLDRDRKARTSKALWIPVAWLLIAGSRNVGEWVQTLSGGQMDISRGDAYLEGSPLDRNVLGALIALGIIVLFRRRRQVGALLRNNAPIFLYLFYCAASVLWSDYPGVGIRRWNRALGDFVMVMVVLTDPDRSAAIKRFLSRTGFVLIPLSVLFIRYYPELGRAYGMDGSPYWGGVTGGKNSLGMICMIFGLGSLWRIIGAYQDRDDPYRKRRLIAHGTLLAMTVYLLHEANSATSTACFVLAGGLMLLTSRAKVARKSGGVHFLVVAVVSVALFALFFDPSGGLVGTLGRNSTLTGRTDIWQRAFGIVRNPLFGTGFETFWLGPRLAWMQKLDVGVNHAHDGYIEVYLNLGWVGLMLIAATMVRGYRNIISGLRRDQAVSTLMLAYFVVGVIYNCTESGFKMMSPVWIFLLLAAMVVPKVSVRHSPAPLDITIDLPTAPAHAHEEFA